MKRNEDRRERSEKSDAKVRVRTGMKAGFDWSTLNPLNWFQSGQGEQPVTSDV